MMRARARGVSASKAAVENVTKAEGMTSVSDAPAERIGRDSLRERQCGTRRHA